MSRWVQITALLWLTGCPSTQDDSPDTDTDTDTDTGGGADVVDLTNGQFIHDNTCMGCHSGNTAMADNSPSMSDSQLENVIQNGQGYMPAHNLSDTDLRDLIAYLRYEYGGG